jgi:hypothetical protein
MLGLSCRAELRLAAGRIDTLVETRGNVYCFEFKLDSGKEDGGERIAAEALAQTEAKEYLLGWEGEGKRLFRVGVSFNYEKRNIGAWKYTAGQD